jgi:hypothetical protein
MYSVLKKEARGAGRYRARTLSPLCVCVRADDRQIVARVKRIGPRRRDRGLLPYSRMVLRCRPSANGSSQRFVAAVGRGQAVLERAPYRPSAPTHKFRNVVSEARRCRLQQWRNRRQARSRAELGWEPSEHGDKAWRRFSLLLLRNLCVGALHNRQYQRGGGQHQHAGHPIGPARITRIGRQV